MDGSEVVASCAGELSCTTYWSSSSSLLTLVASELSSHADSTVGQPLLPLSSGSHGSLIVVKICNPLLSEIITSDPILISAFVWDSLPERVASSNLASVETQALAIVYKLVNGSTGAEVEVVCSAVGMTGRKAEVEVLGMGIDEW